MCGCGGIGEGFEDTRQKTGIGAPGVARSYGVKYSCETFGCGEGLRESNERKQAQRRVA
jgi:hypothetical protein